ncbi:hypothetical protein MUB24_06105 [Lederbergia sp. NSJ-179]|uniref:hypothetical protein n=1 Tax=Lederbergia sp. NSJ-179 TaxID=2931402 RepID=UPI001FD06D1A|nr:hypothetical protein [Lederbergia sp. NSJ-179]MCJ7840499.1 hypothetical protein [Lederbergia sp. NSJ-179]
MTYYEDEILNELEVGEDYTSRQVLIFLYENKNATILSDSGRITNSNEIKYRVVGRKDKYIHTSRDHDRVYTIPNETSKIYEIERL